jgi:hypothetical protein
MDRTEYGAHGPGNLVVLLAYRQGASPRIIAYTPVLKEGVSR